VPENNSYDFYLGQYLKLQGITENNSYDFYLGQYLKLQGITVKSYAVLGY
jgi:hypothetical protein